jgi:hypothetical protein
MSARRPDGTVDPSKIVPPKTGNQAELGSKKAEIDFNAVTINTKVSCNIDDAVAKMLGWLSSPTSLENILIDEHEISEDKLIALDTLVYPLEDHLLELLESAKDRAYQIFADKNATEEIKNQVINDIEKYEAKINKAKLYKLAIDEELSKGTESELIVDKTASEKSGETYIKIISLDRWAHKTFNITILVRTDDFHSEKAKTPEASSASNIEKPWLIPHSSDEKTEQPWFIPARYFARQLVKEDTTLLSKREVLVKKVANALADVGIYKRGNKLPLNPNTIKKALSDINWS